MATLEGIKQRLGWGLARFDNIAEELIAAKDHFDTAMADLEELILADEPEPQPEPEPEPEPTPLYELLVWTDSLGAPLVSDGDTIASDTVFVELVRPDGAWDALPIDDSMAAEGVDSVEFYLDGELVNTEGRYPYGMSGTDAGVPNATVLQPGAHTIKWVLAGTEPAEGTFSLTVEEQQTEPEPEPTPGDSNEPAGMIELFGDLGDTPGPNLANDQPDSDYDQWGWRGQGFVKAVNTADTDIPASPAPVDPENFWEIRWPEGWGAQDFGSGQGGVNIYHSKGWTGKRAKSMYWRFYFYLPSDFETHPHMLKGWWFTHGGHTNHFVPMRSNLGGGFGSNDAFGCYLQINGTDTTRPFANKFYNGMKWSDVPRDQWIKLEMLFVANSDGDTADGKYRCWMNDELVSEHDDVHYFSPLNFELNEFFNRTSYGPVWGGGGDNPLSQAQKAALDDWYVSYSTERIGVDTPTDPTPEPEPEPDPTPEPDPEPSGDWDLVLDFSLRKGEPVPDGLRFKEEQRTADGLLMVYPEGMLDGRGPGRVGIETNIMPQGFKNAMYQYDVTISPNFEDHIVFNKIAHYRFKPHADGFGSKTIDKWKNYRIGYSTSSATATAGYGVKKFYPDYYAGYNSVHGNIRTDKFVPEQKHTVRCAWEWVRTDGDDPRINWYRLRWWIDGVLQGDFPEFPLLGGPEAHYWELAPTWGGSGGHTKTKEDWILFDNIKTWVK